MTRGDAAKGRSGTTTTAEKLDLMFERFRRADGERWKKREIERATQEKVSAAYLSAICRGKISRPGEEMKEVIARTMGFPKGLWELEPEWWDREIERVGHERFGLGGTSAAEALASLDGDLRGPLWGARPDEELPALGGEDLALLVNELFEHMPNRRTGRPHTEVEVSQLSAGALSAAEIARMRSGEEVGPVPEGKLLALCDAFDVSPDYWRVPPDAHEARLEGLAAVERFLAEESGVGGGHRGADGAGGLSEKDRDMLRTIIDVLGRSSIAGRRRRRNARGGQRGGDR